MAWANCSKILAMCTSVRSQALNREQCDEQEAWEMEGLQDGAFSFDWQVVWLCTHFSTFPCLSFFTCTKRKLFLRDSRRFNIRCLIHICQWQQLLICIVKMVPGVIAHLICSETRVLISVCGWSEWSGDHTCKWDSFARGFTPKRKFSSQA